MTLNTTQLPGEMNSQISFEAQKNRLSILVIHTYYSSVKPIGEFIFALFIFSANCDEHVFLATLQVKQHRRTANLAILGIGLTYLRRIQQHLKGFGTVRTGYSLFDQARHHGAPLSVTRILTNFERHAGSMQ